MQTINSNKKVLLYSGGVDSWLIDKLWKPDVKVYINIHGNYSNEEEKRLPNDVHIIDFPLLGKFEMENTIVPMRNLFFLMIASYFGDTICLGATGEDYTRKDKTPAFFLQTEQLLNYILSDDKINRQITICHDYYHLYRHQLIEKYLKQGGTLDAIQHDSFSCYSPDNNHECLSCHACFRKFAHLYTLGAPYTLEQRQKMWNYVKNQIIPTKEQGGYVGTYYTERGEESPILISTVEKLREEFEK